MKVKKAIIYFCYVLVSITLLAHSFIPHVHHDGHICLITEYLCDDHNSCDTGEHHSHCHDNTDSDDCLIKNFILRPGSNNQDTPDIYSFANYTFHFICILPDLLSTDPFDLTDKQDIPYLINYKTVFTNHSHGLRAPPFSISC